MLIESSLRRGSEASPKVAVVTGGFGAIGRHVVKSLAEQGYQLVCPYLPGVDRIEEGIRELGSAGACIHPCAMDMRSPQEVQSIADHVDTRFGALGALVHMASPPIRPAAPALVPDDFIMEHLQVAALGLARLTRALLPLLQRGQTGCIVGILSTVVEPTRPKRWWAYTGGKFALQGILAGLATDVQGSGVRVLSVMPDAVQSNLSRDAGISQDRALRPEDVAQVIVRAVCDEKLFPNGSVVRVGQYASEIGRFEFVPQRAL